MHKSSIVCDVCSEESTTKMGPYPEGWAHLLITEYHPTENGIRNDKLAKDLCPKCLKNVMEGFKDALGS